MVPALLSDSRITALQQALSGLARRQQAIAGNVANVDTPGYRRQDVSFEATLHQGGDGTRLATTSAGHVAVAPAGESLLRSLTGGPERSSTGRNDGNNVDIDYEMTRLAETSLRYQLLTQATSARFLTLRDIVSRVS
jgi:flagellar basal-body rod protein FlgB